MTAPWPRPDLKQVSGAWFAPYLHELHHSHNPKRYAGWKYRLLSHLPRIEALFHALERDEIPYVAVKGIATAALYYPSLFTRPFADVDLFVEPSQFGRATSTILSEGYTLDNSAEKIPKHFKFVTQGASAVELHHRISRDFPDAPAIIEALVSSRVKVDLEGLSFFAPSVEMHAFYTLLHARNHGFLNAPLWCLDLLLMARRAPHLFTHLEELSRQYDARRAHALALGLMRHLFPTEAIPLTEKYDLGVRLAEKLVMHSLKGGGSGYFTSIAVRAILKKTLLDKALWFIERS